jgi:hypothetical protein
MFCICIVILFFENIYKWMRVSETVKVNFQKNKNKKPLLKKVLK